MLSVMATGDARALLWHSTTGTVEIPAWAWAGHETAAIMGVFVT